MPEPKTPVTKTRSEIVNECVNALVACFNYYSDEPLSQENIDEIAVHVRQNLPVAIRTKRWEGIARDYQKRVAENG